MTATAPAITAVLKAALDSLPSKALGLRSRALPTEEGLEDLVDAVSDLLREEPADSLAVVIGSDRAAPAELPDGIEVLPPDEAATRATLLRSSEALKAKRLVYLSVSSTPGESGLDALVSLDGAEVASHFVQYVGGDLPVLQALASSRSRALSVRLREASLETLVSYERTSRELSERAALPVLGFLARNLGDDRPAAAWADRFDSLVGESVGAELQQAARAIEEATEEQQQRLLSDLDEQDLLPRGSSVHDVAKLARRAARYCRAELYDPRQLAGLTSRLFQLLRKLDLQSDQDGDDGDDDNHSDDDRDDSQSTPVLTEEELLERHGAPWLKEAHLWREDSSLFLRHRDHTYKLRLRQRERLLSSRLFRELEAPEVLRGGGHLLAHPHTAAEAPKRGRLQQAVPLRLGDGSAVDRWRAAREDLLAQAGVLIEDEEDLEGHEEDLEEGHETEVVSSPWLAGLGVLLEAPLTAAAKLDPLVEEYVDATRSLLDDATGLQGQQAVDFLHTDLLIADDEQRRLTAARLLPAHPLRLNRFLQWVRTGTCPPVTPEVIGLPRNPQVRLNPAATLDCYQSSDQIGPAGHLVEQAAGDALQQLVTLLGELTVGGAVRITIEDIAEPALAVDALCTAARKVFQRDVSIEALHLEVLIPGSSSDVIAATSQETQGLLATLPGSGLSASVTVGGVTGVWSHLILRGAAARYSPQASLPDGLPPDGVEIVYTPGETGNIAAVSLRGDGLLDGWLDRSARATGVHQHNWTNPPSWHLTSPDALLQVQISPAGWPTTPDQLLKSERLLAYQLLGDNAMAISIVHPSLVPLLQSRVSTYLGLPAVSSAMLESPDLRSMLLRLLDPNADDRHRRGELGKAKAIQLSLQEAQGRTLVLSLDAPDALRWARTCGEAYGSSQRADLLCLELSEDFDDVARIRVLEIKARQKSSSMTDSRLESLSTQARMTAARLRETFAIDDRRKAEALRRLVWMGAGFQRRAKSMESALNRLDARLREGDSVPISVECWVVLDEAWSGKPERSLDCPRLDGTGAAIKGRESVRVRFVDPPSTVERGPDTSGVPPAASEPGDDDDPGASTAMASIEGSVHTEVSGSAPGAGAGDTERAERTGGRPPSQTTPGPEQPQPDDDVPVVSAAAVLQPEAGAEPASGRGVCFPVGTDPRGSTVCFHPSNTRLNHLNVGIVGDMGTGKTQLTKYLVARMALSENENRGHRPRFLIFDYKRDYSQSDFVSAVGAKVIAPHQIPLNLLRLPPDRDTPLERFKRAEFLFDTMNRIFSGIGPVQKQRIRDAVVAAYEDDTEPLLGDVLQHYRAQTSQPDSVTSILQQLVDFQIFADSVSDVEDFDSFFDGVVVIRLDTLGAMQDMKNMIVACLLNLFYEWMLTVRKRPVVGTEPSLRFIEAMLLVDEADNIMKYDFGVLRQILQEGREFGVGVLLASQYLSHFYRGTKSRYDYREPLLTWFVHRIPNANKRDLQGLGLGDRASALADEIKGLELHENICVTLDADGQTIRGYPYWRYRLACWESQFPERAAELRSSGLDEADLRRRLEQAMVALPPDLSRSPWDP